MQWTPLAKIEAKALLRAAAQTTETKGKVPPTDVSVVRPPKAKKHKIPIHNVDYVDNVQDDDLFYVPTAQVGNVCLLSTSRSPETCRRARALSMPAPRQADNPRVPSHRDWIPGFLSPRTP